MQQYRQPMVTATGILLGFTLNFASVWVTHAFTGFILKEIIVATGLISCIILLLIVLYRILNMHYPEERKENYYRQTLRLFIIGISIPFITIMVILVYRFITHVPV